MDRSTVVQPAVEDLDDFNIDYSTPSSDAEINLYGLILKNLDKGTVENITKALKISFPSDVKFHELIQRIYFLIIEMQSQNYVIKTVIDGLRLDAEARWCLLIIIKASGSALQDLPNVGVFASRAISAVNAARVAFAGMDLSNICAPKANLSYGVFINCSLQNANLKGSSFANAYLRESILTGADLEEVNWGVEEAFYLKSVVRAVAHHPTEPWLAIAQEKDILLYDRNSGEKIGLFTNKHAKDVHCLAFSPDGTKLVSGGYDEVCYLWDVHTRQVTGMSLKGHSSGIISIAFSPDSALVGSVDNHHEFFLWEASTQKAILNIRKPKEDEREILSFTCVSFGVDEEGFLITALGSNNGLCFLYAFENETRDTKIFSAHDDRINSIAFNSAGSILATGSRDRSCRLWNTSTLEQIGEPLVHKQGNIAEVGCISFNPEGTFLISGNVDGTCCLWDIKTGSYQLLVGHETEVNSVLFSPDGLKVISASSDTTCRIWDVAAHKQRNTLIFDNYLYYSIDSVAVNPKETILSILDSHGVFRLWDMSHKRFFGNPMLYEGGINSIAFSPDGTMIVSGNANGTCCIWDVLNQRLIGKPFVLKDSNAEIGNEKEVSILQAEFSQDGKEVVALCSNGVCCYWDIFDQQLKKQFQLKEDTRLMQTEDEILTRLESGADLGFMGMGRTIKESLGDKFNYSQGYEIESVAFNSDRSRIVMIMGHIFEEKVCCIFDLGLQKLIVQFGGYEGLPRVVATSFNGYMMVGCTNGTCHLWKTDSPDIGKPLVKHNAAVTGIDFSSDNFYVVTGSVDKTCCIWDVRKRALVLKIEWNTEIGGVKFLKGSSSLGLGYDLIIYDIHGVVSLWKIHVGSKYAQFLWLTQSPGMRLDVFDAVIDDKLSDKNKKIFFQPSVKFKDITHSHKLQDDLHEGIEAMGSSIFKLKTLVNSLKDSLFSDLPKPSAIDEAQLLCLTPDELSKALWEYTVFTNIRSDKNYVALVQRAVLYGMHLQQHSSGDTPLHSAFKMHQADKAMVLLKEISKNVTNGNGVKALSIRNSDNLSVLDLYKRLRINAVHGANLPFVESFDFPLKDIKILINKILQKTVEPSEHTSTASPLPGPSSSPAISMQGETIVPEGSSMPPENMSNAPLTLMYERHNEYAHAQDYKNDKQSTNYKKK